MSLYRSLIKQSFIIAWQHKYLWFFGLFATLLASNLEVELVNRFANRSFTLYDWQRWADTGLFSGQAWHNLIEMARLQPWSFASLILVLLILAALLIGLLWLSVVSQVALVSSANKALGTGRKSTVAERRHDTAVGFQEGRKYFWPVLWLNVLVRAAVSVLALVTVVPVMIWSAGQGFVFGFFYLVIFIVFLAIALALALMAKYAIADIVIKRRPLREAISASWRLFWDNWLVSLEMAVSLFALSLVGSLAIIIAVMIVAIPVALLYIAALVIGSYILFILVLLIGILASIGVVVIGGSILTVVQTTAWVGLYNQLMGKGAESKIERVFKE